jgi:hypothetical protein
MKTELTPEVLVVIYKRENQELATEFYRTQAIFDEYVFEYAQDIVKKDIEEISDEELIQLAYEFVDNNLFE